MKISSFQIDSATIPGVIAAARKKDFAASYGVHPEGCTYVVTYDRALDVLTYSVTAPPESVGEYVVSRIDLEAAPRALIPPRVVGAPEPGAVVSATPALWAVNLGHGLFVSSYVWMRDGAPIAAAVDANYALTHEDDRHALSVEESAAAAEVSARATSAASIVAYPAPVWDGMTPLDVSATIGDGPATRDAGAHVSGAVGGAWSILVDGEARPDLAEIDADGVATIHAAATIAGGVVVVTYENSGGAVHVGFRLDIAAAPTPPARMQAPIVDLVGETSVIMTLAANPDDGGSAVTSCDVRHSQDGTTWTLIQDVPPSLEITELESDRDCFIQSRAVNAAGAGEWSASALAHTLAALPSWRVASTALGVSIEANFAEIGAHLVVDIASPPNYAGVYSAPLADLALGPVSLVAGGWSQDGDEITIEPGLWVYDATYAPMTFGYQWKRSGEIIPGSTNATYTLMESDGGDGITCEVSAVTSLKTVTREDVIIPQPVPTYVRFDGAPENSYRINSLPALMTARGAPADWRNRMTIWAGFVPREKDGSIYGRIFEGNNSDGAGAPRLSITPAGELQWDTGYPSGLSFFRTTNVTAAGQFAFTHLSIDTDGTAFGGSNSGHVFMGSGSQKGGKFDSTLHPGLPLRLTAPSFLSELNGAGALPADMVFLWIKFGECYPYWSYKWAPDPSLIYENVFVQKDASTGDVYAPRTDRMDLETGEIEIVASGGGPTLTVRPDIFFYGNATDWRTPINKGLFDSDAIDWNRTPNLLKTVDEAGNGA